MLDARAETAVKAELVARCYVLDAKLAEFYFHFWLLLITFTLTLLSTFTLATHNDIHVDANIDMGGTYKIELTGLHLQC